MYDWLESRILFGMKVGLENMRVACSRLGNPQVQFKSILVGGTNGKGSVSSLLTKLLSSDLSAPKVGLYTSPHLVGVEERIQVQGQFICSESLTRHLLTIQSVCEDLEPTFFEVLTLVAFLEFAEQKVDYAVIEVGLGGRLDSTNVVEPILSILCSIGLDHTEILGSDLKQILFEKNGITRPNIPVLSGIHQSELRQALKVWHPTTLWELDENLTQESIDFGGESFPTQGLSFKERNQYLALGALDLLIPEWQAPISRRDIIQQHTWVGRFQWIHFRDKQIFVDGAHNEAGALALRTELQKQNKSKISAVIAMVGDKDAQAWFEVMSPVLDKVYLCRGESPRFKSAEDLSQYCADLDYECCDSLATALARASTHQAEFMVTGSLYLVGELVNALKDECPEFAVYQGLSSISNERAPQKRV